MDGRTSSKVEYSNSTDFDLWIKMATDNKINAKNSWNFALIDYFHDLSLLKDGDGINFQKASATLDGCVKIYSSRVDSAATEIGILLSGLATQQQQQRDQYLQKLHNLNATELDSDSDDEEDPEYGSISKRKTAANKRKGKQHSQDVEGTTVGTFESIRARKVDYELQIDPIFKRALSDFDEGGAKHLLLNMLNVDSTGRVMFDTHVDTGISSDRVEDEAVTNDDAMELDIDIDGLRKRFLPDDMSGLLICPSMKDIEEMSRTLKEGNLLETLVREQEESSSKSEIDQYPGSIFFDDEFEDDGYGAERSMNNITLQRFFDESRMIGEDPLVDEVVLDVPDYELLAYFDRTLKKNWMSRPQVDNWKITNLKQRYNIGNSNKLGDEKEKSSTKSKGKVIVNFLDGQEPDEEELFADSNNTNLPKHQWYTDKLTNYNLLLDDIPFTSKRLIRLFTKPDVILRTFNKRTKVPKSDGYTIKRDEKEEEDVPADQEYWSQKYQEQSRLEGILREDILELQQSYHQSFFEDDIGDEDDIDGVNFFDPMGDNLDSIGGYGSQLLLAKYPIRPKYINFSRVAKRVDVKLLKDNLWECLETSAPPTASLSTTVRELTTTKYKPDQANELSTSFCFICLLHLANEHSLDLQGNKDSSDVSIKIANL